MASLFNFPVFFFSFLYVTVIASGGGVVQGSLLSSFLQNGGVFAGVDGEKIFGLPSFFHLSSRFVVSSAHLLDIKSSLHTATDPQPLNSITVQMSSSSQGGDLVNLVCRLVIMTKSGTSKGVSHIHVYIFTYTYIHIHMYTYTHIYKYIYIYTLKFSLFLS